MKRALLLAFLSVAGPLFGGSYPQTGPYAKWSVRTVTITSLQVLALDTVPFPLTPALGADCMQTIFAMTLRKPAGTAYADIAAGDNLVIETTTAVAQETIEPTGFLDQATEQSIAIRAATAVRTGTSFNLPIQVRLLGPITTGTSPLHLTYVYYQDCAS